MLSDVVAPAGHGARPPVAELDGCLRQPPSLSLPAADHGQYDGLGDPVPVHLHGRMERRAVAKRHHHNAGAASAGAGPLRHLALLARRPDHASAVSVPHAAWLGHDLRRVAQSCEGRHPAPGRPDRDGLAAVSLHHELDLHPARPHQVRARRAFLLHHPGRAPEDGSRPAGDPDVGVEPDDEGPVRGLEPPTHRLQHSPCVRRPRRRQGGLAALLLQGGDPGGAGHRPRHSREQATAEEPEGGVGVRFHVLGSRDACARGSRDTGVGSDAMSLEPRT